MRRMDLNRQRVLRYSERGRFAKILGICMVLAASLGASGQLELALISGPDTIFQHCELIAQDFPTLLRQLPIRRMYDGAVCKEHSCADCFSRLFDPQAIVFSRLSRPVCNTPLRRVACRPA